MSYENVNTTRGAQFIPELWATEVLNSLRAKIVLARTVRIDSELTTAAYGDILNIPIPGYFSAESKSADTAIEPQGPTGYGTVQVSLTNHYVVPILVEDIVRAQSMPTLRQAYINEAARALAEQVESSLAALYSGFSGTDLGTPGVALSYDTILTAKQTLDDNNAPEDNRHLFMTPANEIALMGDADLAPYFAYSQPNAIASGINGKQIAGFTCWSSTKVGSSGSTYYNMAYQQEAMILATRAIPATTAGASSATVQDPVSGLVLNVVEDYSSAYMGTWINVSILYGVAELRDACGIAIQS